MHAKRYDGSNVDRSAVNFINILQAAFAANILALKNYKAKLQAQKVFGARILAQKLLVKKVDEIDTRLPPHQLSHLLNFRPILASRTAAKL